jgi:hypothetical protein
MKYAFVITLQLCEVAESVGVLASGWTFGVWFLRGVAAFSFFHYFKSSVLRIFV